MAEPAGPSADPLIETACLYEGAAKRIGGLSGNITLHLRNLDPARGHEIRIIDHGYKKENHRKLTVKAGGKIELSLASDLGWYDFSVRCDGDEKFEKCYAARVETGKTGSTDPVMGGMA